MEPTGRSIIVYLPKSREDKYKEIRYTLIEGDILRTGIVEKVEEFYIS